MSVAVPCLYRISLSDGEATGEVLFFCCEDCRENELDGLRPTCHDLFYKRGDDSSFVLGSACDYCGEPLE